MLRSEVAIERQLQIEQFALLLRRGVWICFVVPTFIVDDSPFSCGVMAINTINATTDSVRHAINMNLRLLWKTPFRRLQDPTLCAIRQMPFDRTFNPFDRKIDLQNNSRLGMLSISLRNLGTNPLRKKLLKYFRIFAILDLWIDQSRKRFMQKRSKLQWIE